MITNTSMLRFQVRRDSERPDAGTLLPLEAAGVSSPQIPFEIKRIYYIYGVKAAERRGFHAHYDLEQALICVHGSVKIHIEVPGEEQEIVLDDPAKALYIGPMVWREMYEFSPDAVLLVLASEHYTETDYIRDKAVYDENAKNYFRK